MGVDDFVEEQLKNSTNNTTNGKNKKKSKKTNQLSKIGGFMFWVKLYHLTA